MLRENAVAIVNQVTVRVVEANNFSQLLQGPVRTRVLQDWSEAGARYFIIMPGLFAPKFPRAGMRLLELLYTICIQYAEPGVSRGIARPPAG